MFLKHLIWGLQSFAKWRHWIMLVLYFCFLVVWGLFCVFYIWKSHWNSSMSVSRGRLVTRWSPQKFSWKPLKVGAGSADIGSFIQVAENVLKDEKFKQIVCTLGQLGVMWLAQWIFILMLSLCVQPKTWKKGIKPFWVGGVWVGGLWDTKKS